MINPTIVKHPDRPGRIYPDTYGGFPPCRGCLRRVPDQADNLRDGHLVSLCSECARSPRPLAEVVTPEMRAAQWERLAVWHVNQEVGDELIGRALAELAPHLDEDDAHLAFLDLVEALQWRQRVHEGDVTVHEVEPVLADPGALADAAQDRVEDALRALVGGA